ncbi:prolipoprotein diacylglyceryl transferase [Streptococcus sp. DD12]|uniref:prolipoprotein diacylglyceryl transferase n=1 Tax=Streptococcus sp. DD12 TaxID=1777880 RepID=UPI0007960031|nr:prolipoprotein diacylglyceryl transferase [Streptococcus sp. DD12]KXT75742.1 Prolipoprotein diacylglyceryl transferase [Streptococcus sp. DD12]
MINPIAFQLGPFAIHWYAICIVTGLVLAVLLAIREGKRWGISSDDILDFILWAFPLAIVGARLYYVIFQWSYYQDHPDQIIAIWQGGLAIYGGIISGFLVLVWFCYQRGLSLLTFMDVAVPGLMLAQALGRWGNFFNQEAYGAIVKNLDWLPAGIRQQMFIAGHYRQPTFLYESSWNLLGFLLVIACRHRFKALKAGDLAGFYLIWYGLGRFVIEGMRTDSLMLAGIRVSQWLSALGILVGLIFLLYRHVYSPNTQKKRSFHG